jgi:hypothetical protein
MLATALKAKRHAPLRLEDANRKTQHKYLYGPPSCEQNRIPPTVSVMWDPAPARAKRQILRPAQRPEQGVPRLPRGSLGGRIYASKLATRQAEQVL